MLKRLACLLLGVFANAPAFAHVASGHHGSFLSGFSHPFFSLDHIVVMVAVGMWAVSVGGRAQWLIPTTFIGSTTVGYMLSIAGIDVPSVESMILVSVLAAGIAIAAPASARQEAVRRHLARLDGSLERSVVDLQDLAMARLEDRQGLGMSRMRSSVDAGKTSSTRAT
ncbi:hypothetical protein GCM10010869_71050 [Mesorhizobium tianshanense]|uniref:HupE/UreJ protein n=1 Tax=Mesorhizobium tianshanense TaxID=39844 RepID=A0A562MH86_9HYPH|nr:HupE/UreJ family protein [Mesorhizobium tianshanense]TWI19232.1 HupE/UreJ protein [Mesorhizobium tianshanense]GLS41508.1 hypothetical protein GCM10010869_71050 [Mesorhizobium tianshanense]